MKFKTTERENSSIFGENIASGEQVVHHCCGSANRLAVSDSTLRGSPNIFDVADGSNDGDDDNDDDRSMTVLTLDALRSGINMNGDTARRTDGLWTLLAAARYRDFRVHPFDLLVRTIWGLITKKS